MSEQGLRTVELVVRYGGVTAVDAVSLDGRQGRLTGLIGPNGAGKTSFFNACNGLVRVAKGTVLFGRDDITHRRPATRGRLGLGRTFQHMQLFDALSVAANVSLGLEARLAGARILGQIAASRTEKRRVEDATEMALSMCGLMDIVDERVADLSTGQRRLVDLARVYCGGFDFLLLDEPSSGLTQVETARLGSVLRSIVEGGTGILLVEHDMSLVMRVCEYIYVLDFGELVFEGAPSDVGNSEIVRSVYLGSEYEESADADVEKREPMET